MIQAVIFDLDGVLANSGDCHSRAWVRMAWEQGIELDAEKATRLTHLEDQQGLEQLLKKAKRPYSLGERVALAARKNDLYDGLIAELTPGNVLPGALDALNGLRDASLKTAVIGPDANAAAAMRQMGLDKLVDKAFCWPQDGEDASAAQALRQAAFRLTPNPESCLAVLSPRHEKAAVICGMKAVIVGGAENPDTLRFSSLSQVNLPALIDAGLV